MKISFNNDWVFYKNEKTIKVDLPHDAMIDSQRSATAKGGGANAYFDGGIYTYEKTFVAPQDWQDKNVTFEFEGVYRNTKVYINETLAGEWAYGYTQFYVSADKFLKFGKDNVVKVVADNSMLPNSRWYTGGGIYRPVNIIVKSKEGFKINSVVATTVSINPAVINCSSQFGNANVEYEVFYKGESVASRSGNGEIVIDNAHLWSDCLPNLYTLKATLVSGATIIDCEQFEFGIRTLDWSNKGLFVNGKKTLLRGGCIHHDNGILGARCYAEAEYRKVKIIKDAGFNALRISHNPCSVAMLEACDKYGIYVIDEAFDMWYMHKKKYDYASDFIQWHKLDIAAMIDKDKKHPSVIMYSIGNEVSEPYEQKGIELTKEMVDFVHSLDSTRAVTAGINYYIINNAKKGKGIYREEVVQAENQDKKPKKEKATSSTLFNIIACKVGASMNKMGNSDEVDEIVSPCLDFLDIAGYNYASGRYPLEAIKHPTRVIYGSETYPQDIYKNWEMVKKYPYLVGDFMWTAWDYLGEVGLGGWAYEKMYGFTFEKPYPWIIADTGAIDIIGTVGAEAKYASTVWGLENSPYIAVKPINHKGVKVLKSVWRGTNAISSWAWAGCEGENAEVEVYSNAAFIMLKLNGKILGTKKLRECKATFKVKYDRGNLQAVALDLNKNEVASSVIQSADKALKIQLLPENNNVKKDDVFFVNVILCDNNRTVESNADCQLTAEITNAELLAFGSAQQKTEEKYCSTICESYYGRALIVAKANNSGKIDIKVSGKNIKSETISIIVR